MRVPVLLLHGLWMRGAALGLLSRRLRAAGFAVSTLNYPSVRGGPDAALPLLIDSLRALGPGPVRIVAHSLGGLMALSALQAEPQLPVDRVLCLGSPLCGSAAAHGLSRWPGGQHLLGDSLGLLRTGVPAWQGTAQVAMIAGNLALGLGVLPGRLSRPHDGTVAVAETRLPGLAAHCVLPVSHSGLVFSRAVATQAAQFLRDGRFQPEPAAIR
ncbi:MAG: alpha/beta hydrolase [Xanthomonadaceae bacterium]|nr:alpha/beta hydrolase [Xanthomonadaceae bacterium]MDP2184844.1 alpha/beta hydrolase [Xanthomonadales bacterium]MDZ4115058.1 alpha/beta hydrolase [Xanthomonadaceae bacterium]MDZ4378126.1 alpha/beta hydrolase [Xanthomonadaceae bacterium]